MANKTPVKKTAKAALPKASINKSVVAEKPANCSAERFTAKLATFQSDIEKKKIQRYFKPENDVHDQSDEFMGVRMGTVFELAKEFIEMVPAEIEKLLESNIHEVRAGAVSIMDKQSRSKKITPARRKELFDLYINRHDRINNWDLVDLGCLHMVGSYLIDKPRKILYQLARSKNTWERRTAILGTCYFIKQNDITDTFKIAEMLLKDKEDLVHKGVGWMLRFAGDKDPQALISFLNKHASIMPRTMLRYTIEKLDKKQREHYLGLKHIQ